MPKSCLAMIAAVSLTLTGCAGTDSPTEPTPVCSISIAPVDAAFGSDGGSAVVTVTAGAGCAWTAAPNADWIVVTSGGTGIVNGTVGYATIMQAAR